MVLNKKSEHSQVKFLKFNNKYLMTYKPETAAKSIELVNGEIHCAKKHCCNFQWTSMEQDEIR